MIRKFKANSMPSKICRKEISRNPKIYAKKEFARIRDGIAFLIESSPINRRECDARDIIKSHVFHPMFFYG